MSDPRAARPPTARGLLAGAIDPDGSAALATVEAVPGLSVLHRRTGVLGTVVAHESGRVHLRDARGVVRSFVAAPGDFAVDGRPVRLVAPTPRPARAEPDAGARAATPGGAGAPSHLARARVTDRRTASGSRAVVGARARVARAARILVEGVHDAELVEHVWGDDLRLEGIVVERLDGADHLEATLARLGPGPGRRVGVLLDHLVPGSKEARLAAAVAGPSVLVTGTPYVDVWQAIRPRAAGIAAWPEVPKGTDWKSGVCTALGYATPVELWRHLRHAVRDWTDLEQPLVRAVEELVDFVTAQ